MKKFIIIYLERRENILNFIHYFNKYRVCPATLFHFLILAPCVFEFDTPALEEEISNIHVPDSELDMLIVKRYYGNHIRAIPTTSRPYKMHAGPSSTTLSLRMTILSINIAQVLRAGVNIIKHWHFFRMYHHIASPFQQIYSNMSCRCLRNYAKKNC